MRHGQPDVIIDGVWGDTEVLGYRRIRPSFHPAQEQHLPGALGQTQERLFEELEPLPIDELHFGGRSVGWDVENGVLVGDGSFQVRPLLLKPGVVECDISRGLEKISLWVLDKRPRCCR
jgi:hypothetical protein